MIGFLLGFVAVCQYVSHLPQIIQLIRTKKSGDLSISTYLMWTVSATAYFGYVVIERRKELYVTSGSNSLLTMIVLFLILRYMKGK